MHHFAIYSTKVGYIKIEHENEKIVGINKVKDKKILDYGMKTPVTEEVFAQLTEYLEGRRKKFEFPYEMHGTEFQKRVWQALCDIPYGETRSYKDIAIAIGNEKASRAVGMANNKNPIGMVVPCHRVIGANGKLVGYAGGIEMKIFLLDMEVNNK